MDRSFRGHRECIARDDDRSEAADTTDFHRLNRLREFDQSATSSQSVRHNRRPAQFHFVRQDGYSSNSQFMRNDCFPSCVQCVLPGRGDLQPSVGKFIRIVQRRGKHFRRRYTHRLVCVSEKRQPHHNLLTHHRVDRPIGTPRAFAKPATSRFCSPPVSTIGGLAIGAAVPGVRSFDVD